MFTYISIYLTVVLLLLLVGKLVYHREHPISSLFIKILRKCKIGLAFAEKL